MKTKDIIIGNDYAYADHYDWSRGRAERITVLAVKQPREVWNEFRSYPANDGVLVRTEQGRERVVIPADIRQDWATYAAERDEELRRRMAARQAAQRATEDMADRLRALGVPDHLLPCVYPNGTVSTRVTLSYPALVALLEQR